MKYRKRSLIVEANQFDGETRLDGVSWNSSYQAYVTTIHNQKVFIEKGDWILPEPDGKHYYPVKDDIFKATYTPDLGNVRLRIYTGFCWLEYDSEGMMCVRGDCNNSRLHILEWLNTGVQLVATVRHDQDIDFYYRETK